MVDAAKLVTVTMLVVVEVDPSDVSLAEIISASSDTLSIDEIVRAEVESNLESVSYVRRVSINHDTQGEHRDHQVRIQRQGQPRRQAR